MSRLQKRILKWAGCAVLAFFCAIPAYAENKPFKCFVTGSDTLSYIIELKAPNAGIAGSAARHGRIQSKNMGRVEVRGVIECTAVGRDFRTRQAQEHEKRHPEPAKTL